MAGRRIVVEFLGADKSLSRTVDDVDRSTSGLSSTFAGIGKAAKVGFAGVATAAAGAGAAITASIATALDQEKSADRLAASLGATPAVAKKYGEVAGNLYAGAWGESMDDVNHAVESVASSFKGLSKSADLERVSAQALDFAAIFEVDVPRATSVASTVLKSGLAKDATEAFDLLTAASQRVPAALREDVMDASEEYGQFFKTLGFSGEEAFGVLVKGAEKGMYGIDKAGDAIKEFTIRATDGSDATQSAFEGIGLNADQMANDILAGGSKSREAFGDILDGLLSIKDPAEQSRKALALFGTPLEDLNVKDIPGFLKSLRDGSKGMKDWKGSIDEAGKTLNDNAATNLESFKRQITQGFVDLIGGKALPVITKFSAKLAKDVGPVMRRIGAWVQEEVVPALREFGAWLGEKLPPVFARIRQFIAQFTGDGSGKLSKFIEDVKQVWNDGVTIVTKLWEMFGENIVEFLKGWVDSILTIVSGLWDVVRGIFKTFSALLKGDWKGVWKGLQLIFKGFGKILLGLVKNVWNTIQFAFKNAGVVLKKIFSGIWEGIKNVARSGLDWIVGRIKALPGMLKDLGGLFVSAGKWLIGKFFDGLKKLGDLGVNIGKDLLNGIIGAINSGITAINDIIPDSIGVGPVSINLPNDPFPTIPELAKGGIVKARRGGTVVRVGEAGHDEAVVPLSGPHAPRRMAMGDDRPILVQLMLDGKVLEQALIRRTRETQRPLQVKTL